MIPVVSLICWSLIVIEELGHVIEDPFNVHVYLPSIGTSTIYRNSKGSSLKDRVYSIKRGRIYIPKETYWCPKSLQHRVGACVAFIYLQKYIAIEGLGHGIEDPLSCRRSFECVEDPLSVQ